MAHDPSTAPVGGGPHAAEELLALYALEPAQVDASASAHIRTCARCRSEVSWLTQVLTAADGTRDRAACPEVEQLVAYALGELRGAKGQAIAGHLHSCVQCAADIALTREQLSAASGPAHAPLAAIRRVLAALVTTQASPALALRDATTDDTEPQVYAAEGLEVAVRRLVDGAHRGQHLLVGAIGASADTQSAALLARLLRLASDPAATPPVLVAEVPITFDTFEFEAIPTGTYQFELLCDDRLIVIGPISV
jgi:hypothetical protein